MVGAGAAGLMAAIQAGRRGEKVVALDSAKHLGAKILVAGGGRCNVTHHAVDETAFSGSTPPAIRRVLARFPVEATLAFFAELGVRLKREDTGKLFPATDRARTVLDALLAAAAAAGVELAHPFRVETVRQTAEGFSISGPAGTVEARRVVLATGGMALPRSGSDGHGYAIARSLGHTTTARIFPALVPLTLARGSFARELPGVACEAAVTVRSGSGRRLVEMRGSLLCTHTGLSGPVVLDVSRHLADALLAEARVDPASRWERLSRDDRRRLETTLTAWRAPVTGDLGFAKAEVTAGGVPLSEVRLTTMESRRTPGLFLCGEILDVDGRIGGFNFQWAWASGYVAGSSSLSGGITPDASR